jgi:hypothetical protein
MLPSNNSNPCGKLKNEANIVDLFDFLAYPPLNLNGSDFFGYLPFANLGNNM